MSRIVASCWTIALELSNDDGGYPSSEQTGGNLVALGTALPSSEEKESHSSTASSRLGTGSRSLAKFPKMPN